MTIIEVPTQHVLGGACITATYVVKVSNDKLIDGHYEHE